MGRLVTRALAAWIVVLALVRLVIAQPERCRDPGDDTLRASAQEAVGWLVRNQGPDSRWLYRYSVPDDRDLGGYNIVRHAGVSLSLAQAARAGVPGAADAAAAGLRYATARLVVTEPGALAFAEPGTVVDTGSTALLVAALVEWREATAAAAPGSEVAAADFTVDDTILGQLGRFLASQLDGNGAVAASWLPGSGPLPQRSRFFTGEATWALVRLHRALPGGPWREPAARALGYLIERRDDVEDWFPPIADHWGAYALAEAAAAGDLLDTVADHVDRFAVRQAVRFGPQVRYEASRTASWFSTLTRGRPPVGAAMGTVGEGLAGLDRLVRLAPQHVPELAGAHDRLAERLRCVAALLADRQVGPSEARTYPRPDRAQGAWLASGVTQMDDQQHALSAILGALGALDGGAGPAR